MQELYKKHRPKRLQDLVGQAGAIKSIEKLIYSERVPHAILLTGPSGVGKTTIARILKKHLKCSDHDFLERNCADFRGIDDIREIRRHCDYRPLGGSVRIFLIDECHKLSNDAQNAFLKLLEDTPSHVYFMLATTDAGKLIKTIHTRCSQIKLGPIGPEDIATLLETVIKKEGFEISKVVREDIIEVSEGSARKALVILEQVAGLESEKEQLQAIQTTTFNKDTAFKLAQGLLFPDKTSWLEVAALLRELNEQEPEGIRYCILGYARAMLVGNKEGKPPNPKFAARAYMIIDHFSRNFYDSKHAGLAACCWEIFEPQK